MKAISTQKVIRWSGIAAMLGGAFLIIALLIHPMTEEDVGIMTTPIWFIAHALGAKGFMLMVLGLFGFYSKFSEKMGKIGVLAFLLGLYGIIYAGFVWMVSAFIQPTLAVHAPELAEETGPLFTGNFMVVLMTMLIAIVLGYVLWGIATWKANLLPRWNSVLFMISAIALIVIAIPARFYLTQIAGSLFGISFIGLGAQVWKK